MSRWSLHTHKWSFFTAGLNVYLKYHVHLYRGAVPNICASISSIPHMFKGQIHTKCLTKNNKKIKRLKQYSSPFSCRTCANCHCLVNKAPPGSCCHIYVWAYIPLCCRYRMKCFVIEIFRRAPNPLYLRTAFLLG